MNKSNSKAPNNSYTLAIDTVSNNPTASIFKDDFSDCDFKELKNTTQNINSEIDLKISSQIEFINLINESSEQDNTSSQNRRYDTANFPNKVFELLDNFDVNAHQMSKVLYCSGPGPFSPIRVGVIITRILKRINPEIQVYKFNLLYLLYHQLKPKLKNTNPKQFSLHINAGLKGYFKETYNFQTNKIIERAHLVKSLDIENIVEKSKDKDEELFQIISEDTKNLSVLIDTKKTNFNLSKLMIDLAHTEHLDDFEIDLDGIQPEYLKEASVTVKKN